MDSGKSWNKNNFVSNCKDKEIMLFWPHCETQMSIKETISGKRKRG